MWHPYSWCRSLNFRQPNHSPLNVKIIKLSKRFKFWDKSDSTNTLCMLQRISHLFRSSSGQQLGALDIWKETDLQFSWIFKVDWFFKKISLHNSSLCLCLCVFFTGQQLGSLENLERNRNIYLIDQG